MARTASKESDLIGRTQKRGGTLDQPTLVEETKAGEPDQNWPRIPNKRDPRTRQPYLHMEAAEEETYSAANHLKARTDKVPKRTPCSFISTIGDVMNQKKRASVRVVI